MMAHKSKSKITKTHKKIIKIVEETLQKHWRNLLERSEEHIILCSVNFTFKVLQFLADMLTLKIDVD